jgi:hypothetical protein
MRPLPLLLIFILSLPCIAGAQTEFYPGFAVTSKGDTLKGYFGYKKWEQNPKSVQFKTEPNSQAKKLTTGDIGFFSIDLGVQPVQFQKYTGSITTDRIDPDHIQIGRDSSYRVDTVFLKVLVKGPNVTLYSFDDDLKTRFFISDNQKPQATELIYHVYYSDNGSGTPGGRTIHENTFKRQLLLLAQKYKPDDQLIQVDIEKSVYSISDIQSAVYKIDGLSEKNIPVEYKTRAPKTKLVIMLGLFAVVAGLVISKM